MKKEASGKKSKWLWIVLGAVLLLAIVGVVLALVLGGGGKKETVGGRPELYWNIDREENVNPDTGLSIRKSAEDGNFYVRFAHDGEQVEIPVADKKLVNFIDSLDLMSLVLDKNGFAVDVKAVEDVANITGEGVYVQSVNGNTLTANSAITMNGRKLTIKLSDDVSVYNVSGKGKFVGEKIEASSLNPMDTISVYGTLVPEDSDEESVVTHIFVLNKPAESAVYWRADQFYNSTDKVTTREPDENGAYTIKWYVDGETVDLKCKDKAMVSTIDSANYHWCHWGLEFDEEGYIVDILDSFLASRTLMQCERYDITELNEDGSYVATSLIKNNGAFVQGVVDADCPIYDVSKTAIAEGQANRKLDSLKLNDRVCIWTDTMGKPVLIYVTNRIIESPPYWNMTRSYDSTAKLTTREPVNGYYEIEMLEAGKTKPVTYRTKDIALATAIDTPTGQCVGLALEADGKTIKYVYDMICIFGNDYFCNGYFVSDVTGTVATFLSPAYSGYTKNGVLAVGAKVYNVSTHGQLGAETTLQIGDQVYACKTPTGELANAYVARRVLGIDTAYWNITRSYDSTKKETTRTPDDEGYYVFEMAHKGNVVTVKTKDKEIANFIDSQASHRYFSLIVKNGIITEANTAYYCLGGSRYASHYVTSVDGNKITTLNSSKKTAYEITLGDNCQIFNVSTAFNDHMGEKTKLKVGDYVTLYRDVDAAGTVLLGWVRNRKVGKMAWPVNRQYDSSNKTTTREAIDGWYYVDLCIDGKIGTYKTQNKAIMSGVDSYSSAFGVELKGDVIVNYAVATDVDGVNKSAVQNYTVASANSKKLTAIYTLGHSSNTGKTEEVPIAKNCKIYDVSGSSSDEGWGAAAKMKEGDVIRAWLNDDGEAIYIYITAHCTRAGGFKSLCDHCNKVVYWNPYTSSSSIVSYDCHYYLSTDVELKGAQMGVYSSARDIEIVLDLNGKTLFRDGGRLALVRYNDKFVIMDSVGTGVMKTVNNTSNGGVIMLTSNGFLDLLGGTLTIDEHEVEGAFPTSGGIISCSDSEFNMYGGKIMNGYVGAKTSDGAKGGNLRISGGAVFNMYGGTISGGVVSGKYTVDGTQKETSAFGGNIYAESKSTVVNIKGGTIVDGLAGRGGNMYAADGVYNIEGGTISGGVASRDIGNSTAGRGGNIFTTGTLNVKGGTITGGVATTGSASGGNIMATGLKAGVYVSGDAVITGGTSPSGANIYLMYSNLEVTGGSISDGGIGATGTNTGGGSSILIAGGNIKGDVKSAGSTVNILERADGQKYYISESKEIPVYFREDGSAYFLNDKQKETALYPDYRTNINITGGNVDGVVRAEASYQNKIAISGKPVIKALLLGNTLVVPGSMSSGASVRIDATEGVFTTELSNASSFLPYFDAVKYNYNAAVTADGKYLEIVNDPNAQIPAGACLHCGEFVDWVAWDGVTVKSGHYVLEDNIYVDNKRIVSEDVVIDLNGHTISPAAGVQCQVFQVGGTLSILDNSAAQNGAITGGDAKNTTETSTYRTRGGNVIVAGGGILNLYSGNITNGIAQTRGGNVYATGRSTFNMYGGKIEGGVADSHANNIYSNGSAINIYGGIVNDTATNGIYSIRGSGYTSGGNYDASLKIAGGTITGSANSVQYEKSGVNVTEVVICGGTIDGGTNISGADKLEISGKPVINKLTLGSGVLIEAPTALEAGASIKINATSGAFTTAFDSDPAAQAVRDANYFSLVDTNAEVDVENKALVAKSTGTPSTPVTPPTDCKHCDEPVTWQPYTGTFVDGGHYYLTDDIQPTSAIAINDGKTVIIDLNGQTIEANGGRAFYVNGGTNPTLVIQDSVGTGEITGGVATGRGGNIYASSGSLYLYGGKIYGGQAKGEANKDGNDVAVYDGEFVIDGNVQIGQTYSLGNAVFTFNTTSLQLKKGTVVGGISMRGDTNETISAAFNADVLLLWGTALTNVEARTTPFAVKKVTVPSGETTHKISTGVFTGTLADAATAVNNFVSAVDGYQVKVSDAGNTLEFVEGTQVPPTPPAPGAACPHCGVDATTITWTPWAGEAIDASGHYKVEGPVNITTGEILIDGAIDVAIDLMGNTVTAKSDARAFNVSGTGSKLSILDSVGGGQVVGGTFEHGATVRAYNATFNLYGGTLTGGNGNGTGTSGRGGNLYISSSTANLYGGTITGGTAKSGNEIYSMYGNLNILGDVTITETATSGYAVYNYGEAGKPYSFTSTAGTINGDVFFNGTNTGIALDGISIDEIQIKNAVISSVGTLDATDKIKVGLTATTTGAFTSDDLADVTTAQTYFEAATGYEIVANGNALEIAEATPVTPPPSGNAPTACEHCTDANITWTPWAGEAITASGHYYLENPVTLSNGDVTIGDGLEVVIDLMGKSITSKSDDRAFYVSGKLYIQDSSADETGTITGGTFSGDHGGTIYVTGSNAVLQLYSGTIVGGNLSDKNGGTIYATSSSTLKISGGTVKDGTARRGGNIYVNGGTFVMEDGVVTNGLADNVRTDAGSDGRGGNMFLNNATVTISGGVVSDGKTVNQYAKTYAGNIMLAGPSSGTRKQITISGDAVISGGEAINGPNVALCYATVDMSGGSLIDGQVYMYGTATAGYSVLNMTGGTIDDLYAYAIDDLNVSGATVINKLTLGPDEVITVGALTGTASIKVNATTGVVTAPLGSPDAATAALDYVDAIAVDKTVVANAQNALEVVDACVCGCKTPAADITWNSLNEYILNGGTPTSTIAADGHYKLTANLNINEITGWANGKYIAIGTSADPKTVTIDLAGFELREHGQRVIYIAPGSELTIMDSSAEQTGLILGASDKVGGVLCNEGGTLNLRSGTIAWDTTQSHSARHAGVIYNQTDASVFNMYGGTIKDGIVNATDSNSALGGNVSVNKGIFNMYGGTIKNGVALTATSKSAYGGNVYVSTAGTFNLYGGQIVGGTAINGGSVWLDTTSAAGATMNVHGGTVTGEIAAKGKAALAVSGDAVLRNVKLVGAFLNVGELTDAASITVATDNAEGKITEAFEGATANAAYIHASGFGKTVTVVDNVLTIVNENIQWISLNDSLAALDADTATAGVQIAETIKLETAATYYYKLTADLNLSVLDATAKNIIEIGANTTSCPDITYTLDLNGFKLTTDCRILVGKNCTLNILDSSGTHAGTFASYGEGSAASGRAVISYGTFNLYSGTLMQPADCTNVIRAAGVVYSNSTTGGFNMYDGVITGGIATSTASNFAMGGNVHIYNGEFNMYGGTISNGTAVGNTDYAGLGGNVHLLDGTTFNMYGGTVAGGTAGQGANVYLEANATLNDALDLIDDLTVAKAP